MSQDLELRMVLTATDNGLSGVVQSSTRDVDNLGESIESTANATDRAANRQSNYADQLTESDRAAGRFYDSLGRLREANGRFVSGAANARDTVDGLNESVDSNARATSNAAEETEGFISSLSAGIVRAGAWGLALAGATAVAVGLAGSLRTDAIREMDVLADTVGTSTQALSEWQHAAETLYMPADKVGDVFKDIQDKVGDFVTTGGGEAADIFENLNVQASELINLSPDQQLLKIGQALESVNNHGQKVFFLESLADDASRLLPLLENGGAELQRLQLQAQVLGISISDIDAAKVSQAGAAMGQVGGIFTGMANDLTIELAPVLGVVSNSLVDAAVNAGGFRGAMSTAVDWIVTGLGYVLDVFQQWQTVFKAAEIGFLTIAQVGTDAMAAVADTTAGVINTVLSPFQDALSWIIEKYSDLIELGSNIPGPFSARFTEMSQSLKGFSADVKSFSVSAEDVVQLNKGMAEALSESKSEFEQLASAAPASQSLKQAIEDLDSATEAAAGSQQDLGKQAGNTGGIVTDQTDTYADLVNELEAEYKLIGLTDRARQIEINQRKLAADATDEQKEAIALLTGRLYDHQQAQKESEAGAEAWATVTENALKSVDDSFRKLFRSGLDGWDDFWGQMKSTAKDMLAELAYTLAKEKLMVSVGMNVTGQGGGSGSASSISGGGQNPLTSMFSGGGMGYATSNLINKGATAISGNALYSVNNPALVNNVAAIKSGAVSVSSPASQVGGAAMAGLSAYGFAQQYGAAGGFAAGTASTALMGGAASMVGGGGFMAGASGALAGLGPVGWAALGIGALLGGLSGKPSDESQWAGFTGADNAAYEGGESGDKFSQENRDAATGVADILNAFNQSLDTFTGQRFVDSIEVTAESVNGFTIKSDSSVANANDLKYSPNGSAYIKGDQEIYAGKNLTDGLNKTIEHMAERAGVALGIYRELAQEDELLAVAYERLNRQQEAAVISAELLGLQYSATGEDGLRYADQLVGAAGGLEAFNAQNTAYYDAFFSGKEKEQQAYQSQLSALADLNSQLAANGHGAVQTKDEFRTLLESLDLTTAAGAETRATLMEYAGTVAALDGAIVAAAEAGASGIETFFGLQQEGESLVETINRASTAFDLVSTMTAQLDHDFDLVSDSGLAAAAHLAELAGGVDQLQQSYSYYIQNILSEEEQTALARKSASAELTDLNATLGLTGSAVIDSRAELTAFINAQDLATEAGREAYATALQMAKAVVTLDDAAQEAATTATVTAAETRDLNTATQTAASVRREELAALNAAKTAQEERNRLLEEEQQRLGALAGIQSGYNALGLDFETVMTQAITDSIEAVRDNFTDAGGTAGILDTQAGALLTELSAIRGSIVDVESAQRQIDGVRSGETLRFWTDHLEQLQSDQRDERNEIGRALRELKVHGGDNPLGFDTSDFIVTDDNADRVAALSDSIHEIQDWMRANRVSDLPTVDDIVTGYADRITRAGDKIDGIESGNLLADYKEKLSTALLAAGVDSLAELNVADADLIEQIRAIEAEFGGLVSFLDDNGNILAELAQEIELSQAELDQLATDFRDDFQNAFASALNIDIDQVGDAFGTIADKYTTAAYSQEELLDIQVESLKTRVDEFADLGITTEMSISDFRTAFEAVQGSVDGETLGRWWAAADAVVDYSNAQQELNELLSNGAGTLDSTTTGMVESIWSDYQSAVDLINESYDTRLQQLKDEQDFIASLQRAVDRLALSDLSPLTPQQREDEAERQWSDLLGQIQAGDYSNADQLAGAGETWIKEAQAMWGSGQQAIDVYNTVSGALTDLQTLLDDESYEDRALALDAARNAELAVQKSILQSQLNTLISTNATLSNMDGLLAALPTQLADNLRGVLESITSQSQTVTARPYAPDAGRDTRPVTTMVYRQTPMAKQVDPQVVELRNDVQRMAKSMTGLMTDQITVTQQQTSAVTGAVERSSTRRVVEMNR